MKKKRKYDKAPKEPNKSHIIRIRVTEDEYNDILEKAMQSPLKNVSAYCRKKLQGKDIGVALTDEERQLIAGVELPVKTLFALHQLWRQPPRT